MTENNRILVREGLKAYRIIPARYHTFLYGGRMSGTGKR
jgi:hypothetical protein